MTAHKASGRQCQSQAASASSFTTILVLYKSLAPSQLLSPHSLPPCSHSQTHPQAHTQTGTHAQLHTRIQTFTLYIEGEREKERGEREKEREKREREREREKEKERDKTRQDKFFISEGSE